MSVDCFLDTNVLGYAFSNLPADAPKRASAEKIMLQHRYGISVQVLQELYVVLTRKAQIQMPATHAQTVIMNFQGTPCVVLDSALVLAGIAISIRYQTSYWDGAIIAAAERLHAPVLYSEDLADGQRYGAVTVVNPFKECH